MHTANFNDKQMRLTHGIAIHDEIIIASSSFPEDEVVDMTHGAMRTVKFVGLDQIPDDRILTKKELAKALGCSTRTLSRLVARFEIPPPSTLGGRKIWIAGKVKAWIASSAARREAEAEKEAMRLRVFHC